MIANDIYNRVDMLHQNLKEINQDLGKIDQNEYDRRIRVIDEEMNVIRKDIKQEKENILRDKENIRVDWLETKEYYKNESKKIFIFNILLIIGIFAAVIYRCICSPAWSALVITVGLLAAAFPIYLVFREIFGKPEKV